MRNKKGLSIGQIFTYIGALVVVGLVFYLGIKAVTNFWEDYHSAQLIKFEKKLITDVNKVLSEPDSMETEVYRLPSGYDQICFINLDEPPPPLNSFPSGLVLVYDSWESGALSNVFLIKDREIYPFFIGDGETGEARIRVENRFLCPEDIEGSFKLRLTGQGDVTVVSEAPLTS